MTHPRTKFFYGKIEPPDNFTIADVPPDWVPYIIRNKLELPLFLQSILHLHPCFGYSWVDDKGICQEELCQLRDQCEKTYKDYQDQFIPKKNLIKNVKKQQKTIDINTTSFKLKGKRQEYKYNTNKIDVLILLFLSLTGNPQKLPSAWHFRTRNIYVDKYTYSCTKSFHSFYYKNKLVLRIWNGKGKRLTVDLTPNIYKVFEKRGYTGGFKLLSQGMIQKSGLCRYRCYIYSAKDMELLAKCVRISLKLKVKNI